MTDGDRPLLHICYARADREWVLGRMVRELGLESGQYRTRENDRLAELRLQEIERAVDECRFTVLIASTAARWDNLAQFAAELAQYAGLEDEVPRLIILARDFAPFSQAERARLPLKQRMLVGLDCSDEENTIAAMERLRELLSLGEPLDERPPCPYPGLARFTEANRDLLFGRDGDKDAVLQRIRRRHTRILVVGPSGSGKSSLIHAAVLPQLPAGGHLVRVVPRGGNLATALRTMIDTLEVPVLGPALDHYRDAVRGATDVHIEEARVQLRTVAVSDVRRRVVVIDPLEEIFAEDDPSARETLFAMLGGLWSLPWCTVILCMRADFYGELMLERYWRELEPHQYPVARLDETGLRAAIVEPARHAGVHIDAALVERLIREIDRDRSSVPLPLLQVALQELWARLRWRYLTLTDYERIVSQEQHGLAAVLAVHAEAVLQALTGPDDRVVAQRILIDLVHLGEGRPHTRRRRSIEDLRRCGDAPEQLERVVETLVAGSLVSTSGAEAAPQSADRSLVQGRHADLAHDTLITGWSVLSGWIAEHRDRLLTQRRLEARAATGGLLAGKEFPEFLRWIAWTATPAGQLLGASKALRALVRRSTLARWLRRGGLAVGLLAATAVAIVVILMAVSAEHARRERAMLEELNKVRAAASLARQDPRAIQLAVKQALAAIRTEPDAEHSPMLMQALLEVAEARVSLPSQILKGTGQVLALSANGSHMTAVVHRDGALVVGPIGSGGAHLASPAPDSPVVAISPRGSWVAYAPNGTLRLWKVAEERWDGDPIELQTATPAGASSPQAFTVAFSGDEARVAVAFEGPGASIGVWNVATHKRVGPILGFDGRAVLALDRTGDRLLTGATPATWEVTLIDLATGHAVAVPKFSDQRATVAAFSPDGKRLAIGSPEGAGIWLLAGGQAVLQRWSGDPRGNVSSLAFSDDGSRLAATTIEGDAVMWSFLERGLAEVSARYMIGDPNAIDNQGPVTPIVFGRDFIAALAINGTDVQVWKVDVPLTLELRHDGPVTSLAAPSSGKWLVTGAVDRTARVWSMDTGELRVRLPRVLPVMAVAADDTSLAVGGADRTVQMFDEHGTAQGLPFAQLSPVYAVAISPAGWIASASGDGTVVVADRQGALKATFEHATKKPGDAYSPDDSERAVTSVVWLGDDRLATAGNNGFVKVWNRDQLDPKVPMRAFHHEAPVLALAWSPDGSLVLSTAADGTAMLWQLADGAGRPLSGHRGPVVSGRFSSDGTQVVTASEDGTVRVWRTRDGRMIQIYDGLGAAARDAAFTPGSCQRLVTAGDDGTLRVWSMASGHELSRIAAHSGRPAGPLVFLDHGRVASGGVDGSVRVFPTCTATVVRALCELRDRSDGGKPGPCPVTEEEEKTCCSTKKES